MSKLKHIKAVFWGKVMHMSMSGLVRWRVAKLMGVSILPPPGNNGLKTRIFIGENVTFDSVYPEDIVIGNHVHITNGCIFLTHYLNRKDDGSIKWSRGKIVIEDHAFIGTRTIVTNPVTIGRYSIVGAGSVVTKDIPPGELWAGVPAKFIKKLNIKDLQ